MVRLSVALRAPAHRERDVVEALRFLRIGTLLESGCRRCCAWVDPDSTIQYVEEWDAESDLRRHARSPRFTSLLAVLESVPERPDVRFDFVTATRGLEFLAELRHDLFPESDVE
jgi:quinol monooxygenase YgiN